MPAKAIADRASQNASKRLDKENAQIEDNRAFERVVLDTLSHQPQLYQQHGYYSRIGKRLNERIFLLTCWEAAGEYAYAYARDTLVKKRRLFTVDQQSSSNRTHSK